jgi:hypothetical protein
VDYFFAGQFVLVWDCNLFELRTVGTQNNGKGNAYNGSVWHLANQNAVGLTGTDATCPNQGTFPVPNAQGRANFLAAWDTYPDTHNNNGINISAPPSGPAEAVLSMQLWRTTGAACYGTAANTGTTDIGFVPTLKIVGFKDGKEMEYTDPVAWTNTSVTVN